MPPGTHGNYPACTNSPDLIKTKNPVCSFSSFSLFVLLESRKKLRIHHVPTEEVWKAHGKQPGENLFTAHFYIYQDRRMSHQSACALSGKVKRIPLANTSIWNQTMEHKNSVAHKKFSLSPWKSWTFYDLKDQVASSSRDEKGAFATFTGLRKKMLGSIYFSVCGQTTEKVRNQFRSTFDGIKRNLWENLLTGNLLLQRGNVLWHLRDLAWLKSVPTLARRSRQFLAVVALAECALKVRYHCSHTTVLSTSRSCLMRLCFLVWDLSTS